MLSRLQELRREEAALRRAGAALREQLTRLRVEELALRAMMRGGEQSAAGRAQRSLETLGQMDNEAAINQTELHLSLQTREEEEEEEEESDS
ncbi:snRNA-activating protein complex subunit 5 [Phaenicophaeus curvirostris]|uniref:snRNA-activating protein complex subunit 5 n=1 Tax=Phaenicophaeus curvirostris TaxID=33595 RepID=UPI0037F10014